MMFSGARTIVLDADSDDDDPMRISVNSKQGMVNNRNTIKQKQQREKISEQDEFMDDSELSEEELPPHLSSKRKQFNSNSNQKTSLAEADDLLNEINNDQYRNTHHRNNHDRFRQNGVNHNQTGK